MNSDLEKLFHPRSIAVYGASNNVAKPGGRPLRYLIDQGFPEIYPINPKYDTVQGITCYKSAASCGQKIDVAIIVVPAKAVMSALEDCAKAHVEFGVILTSGFGEMGPEGVRLQKSIVEYAHSVGIRLLGPNCLGLANFEDRVPMTFMVALEDKNISSGNIALASQSGAFGGHLFGMARHMGAGFNYWITTGNEADIQWNECVEYLANQDSTKVITGYMEDARGGEQLIHALDVCNEKKKPVVLLKVGKTADGSKAASSHTGALAGNGAVYSALFRQKGVIEVEDVYQLLDASMILGQAKKAGEGRVAIITVSGGAGVLLVDNCEKNGLRLAKLNEATKGKLKAALPEFASVTNPIDVTAQIAGSSEMLEDVLSACVEDPDIDMMVIYLGLMNSAGDTLSAQIMRAYEKTDKLIAVTWVEGPDKNCAEMRQKGIMVYPEPVRCMRALGYLAGYEKRLRDRAPQTEKGRQLPAEDHCALKAWLKEKSTTQRALSEYESRTVLEEYGLPVVPGALAKNTDEAVAIAEKLGYPVVLKFDSCSVLHKSDVGAVKLKINSEGDLRKAYDEILSNVAAAIGKLPEYNGILVEKMLSSQSEILLGSKNDKMFGPTVVFGMGGIFVETLKDVSLRVAPVDRICAEDMMSELKGIKLLDGLRGNKPGDKESVCSTIVRFSEMVTDLRDCISEVDINPLFVFEKGKGCAAADALFVF